MLGSKVVKVSALTVLRKYHSKQKKKCAALESLMRQMADDPESSSKGGACVIYDCASPASLVGVEPVEMTTR